MASTQRAEFALRRAAPRLRDGRLALQVPCLIMLVIGAGNLSVCKIRRRLAAFGGDGSHHRLVEITAAARHCMFFASVIFFVLLMAGHAIF